VAELDFREESICAHAHMPACALRFRHCQPSHRVDLTSSAAAAAAADDDFLDATSLGRVFDNTENTCIHTYYYQYRRTF
jgi:hypothetical protein